MPHQYCRLPYNWLKGTVATTQSSNCMFCTSFTDIYISFLFLAQSVLQHKKPAWWGLKWKLLDQILDWNYPLDNLSNMLPNWSNWLLCSSVEGLSWQNNDVAMQLRFLKPLSTVDNNNIHCYITPVTQCMVWYRKKLWRSALILSKTKSHLPLNSSELRGRNERWINHPIIHSLAVDYSLKLN